MSRTYRRKGKEPWWVKEDIRYNEYFRLEWVPLVGKELKKSVAKYHSDAASDPCKEPGPAWFKRMYHTKPERAEPRKLLRNVKILVDYEDSPIFPHHRKPQEYWT